MHSDAPRAVEVLISTFMQLHTFAIQLLFYDELAALHLFDRLFNLPCGSFAKHGSERAEELDGFFLEGGIAMRTSSARGYFYSPAHSACAPDPIAPMLPS